MAVVEKNKEGLVELYKEAKKRRRHKETDFQHSAELKLLIEKIFNIPELREMIFRLLDHATLKSVALVSR